MFCYGSRLDYFGTLSKRHKFSCSLKVPDRHVSSPNPNPNILRARQCLVLPGYGLALCQRNVVLARITALFSSVVWFVSPSDEAFHCKTRGVAARHEFSLILRGSRVTERILFFETTVCCSHYGLGCLISYREQRQ